VFLLFGLATIGMLIVQVHLVYYGISLLRIHWLEHASDIIAGGVIATTGVAIRVLGDLTQNFLDKVQDFCYHDAHQGISFCGNKTRWT
jgi:hypothetical protein